MFLRRRTVVALPLALALGIPTRASATTRRRVLLLGDSLTMGSAGDWTWRYRLDRHLRRSGADVTLVGTRRDLYDNVRDRFGNHDYLDPDFNTIHAAQWGWSLGQAVPEIANIVALTTPDILVVLLGTNDLAQGASAMQAGALMRQLIENARSGIPKADFILVPPPHRYWSREAAFESRLDRLADTMGRPTSRVLTSPVASFHDADTWDGCHPNARGELKIAAAAANALAALGVGDPYPRTLPAIRLGPRVGADVISSQAGGQYAVLKYRSAAGVDHEYVWQRDASASEPWRRLEKPTSGGTWTSSQLTRQHTYEFRLQPAKGRLSSRDVRSRTQRVRSNEPEVLTAPSH